ncbi:MAG: substrate-binding domain-containing protein [Planctomycetes bacterium]|nr:substrate-binding domain-containing protein [Planctomycetota bacterium]
MKGLRACLLFLGVAACGDSAPVVARSAPDVAAAIAPAHPHEVVVFATQSLAAPFRRLAAAYERAHAGSRVTLRCEGGAALLAAMVAEQRADVVAIGDSSLMSRFAAAALLESGSPTELARSRVAIAVATGNPLAIAVADDLVKPGVRAALGKRSSSIGRYGRWLLSHRGVECRPAVETDTADQLIAAVADGRADAAIVYATTALPEGVVRIAVPEVDNQPVLYSISVVRGAAEPQAARAFRALALGTEGQSILREAGFLPIGAK